MVCPAGPRLGRRSEEDNLSDLFPIMNAGVADRCSVRYVRQGLGNGGVMRNILLLAAGGACLAGCTTVEVNYQPVVSGDAGKAAQYAKDGLSYFTLQKLIVDVAPREAAPAAHDSSHSQTGSADHGQGQGGDQEVGHVRA